jgi:hypothetical protein
MTASRRHDLINPTSSSTNRARVLELSHPASLGQPVEFDELANALATSQLQLGRTPLKKDLEQLTVTEQHVQVCGCGVNQEQNEDPDLDRGKTMPGEMRRHIFGNAIDPSAAHKILD